MSAGGEPMPSSMPPSALPPFSAQTRLLVVAPHPDDETIATGLLIQQVQAAGGKVRILLLTPGDNNPWPQRWLERRVRIGAAERRRWGRRRHAEMLQALARLGVAAESLQTLDWPDLGVTDLLLTAGGAAVAEVRIAIARFDPSLVAMPALEDRHPDHGSAHVLVRLAVAGPVMQPRLLTYAVHADASRRGRLEVAGTADQRAKKLTALAEHRTQMTLSGSRMRRLSSREERYADVPPPSSGACRALPWQPPWWLRRWLRLSVVGDAGAQSWRWRDAPLRRDEHGFYHLTVQDDVPGRRHFVRLAWDLHPLWIFDHWGWCEL